MKLYDVLTTGNWGIEHGRRFRGDGSLALERFGLEALHDE
jgi:hypothetical protein